MVGAGALASVAAAGLARAGEHQHGQHDHAKHATANPQLLDALATCITRSEQCIWHCLVTFQEGDNTLAVCAQKVHETIAICTAMATVVASNSSYARDLARVCMAACQDCSDECEKHAKTHQECRACMESCDEVVKRLKPLVA